VVEGASTINPPSSNRIILVVQGFRSLWHWADCRLMASPGGGITVVYSRVAREASDFSFARGCRDSAER
jgi:hypothetical protein